MLGIKIVTTRDLLSFQCGPFKLSINISLNCWEKKYLNSKSTILFSKLNIIHQRQATVKLDAQQMHVALNQNQLQ